jgi:hypothetical protein
LLRAVTALDSCFVSNTSIPVLSVLENTKLVLLFLHRAYELIAVATRKGITIWHVRLNPGLDGRLSVEKVALLSGYEGEV